MDWSREQVVAEIRAVIDEHTEGEVELIDSTELVADLGIDSLGVMEVVADIEDKFDITISDSDLRDVTSFGDVIHAITQMLEVQGRLGEARRSEEGGSE